VHGVPGALGHDAAEYAMSGEGQVPNQVKHFMAHKLVVKAQWAILNCAPAENNRVLLRRPADQPHITQHLLIFAKAEGAGGRDLSAVRSRGQIDGKCLAPDGIGEIDVIGDGVAFAGIDGDKLAVLTHFHALEDAQILAPAALAADAYAVKSLYVRQCAAIQNGQLQIVQLNDDVVDAHPDEGGKKMLGGGDEHTLAHDAGGVADFGYISARGRNLVIVQVGAAKNNAGPGRGRQQTHGHRSPAVETDS
jgi:hypothetical protein